MNDLSLYLLAAQGLLGAVDTLLNHELIAKLPRRLEARAELRLHVARECVYGTLFLGLAWFAWHGAWAALIAALLGAEVLITAVDEWIENRTRVLPQNERVLHVLLTLNLGLLIAALAPTLWRWSAEPPAIVSATHGPFTGVLTVLGCAALIWAVRDTWAVAQLRRAMPYPDD